jgi:cellulose synthase/poly-beta-1,6-N-acetylglucosamine synthase-like glycosyltransferase
MFRPEALGRLIRPFDDNSIGAVSGEVRLRSEESDFGEGESLYYRIERRIQQGEAVVGSLIGVDGGMYALRRDLFRVLPADTILDDFVVAMHIIRHGKRVVYEPTAVATENGTPAASQEFRRRVRVSAGAMQSLKRGDWPPLSRPVVFWQFVSHKLLRWISPILLLILFVTSGWLSSTSLFYRLAFGSQVVVYSLAGAAALFPVFRGVRIVGISFYFVMSQTAMLVGLAKGLLNRQRVAWQRTERTVAASKVDATG